MTRWGRKGHCGVMRSTPPEAEPLTRLVRVKVSEGTYQALHADAVTEGRTIAQSARLFIERALDHHPVNGNEGQP